MTGRILFLICFGAVASMRAMEGVSNDNNAITVSNNFQKLPVDLQNYLISFVDHEPEDDFIERLQNKKYIAKVDQMLPILTISSVRTNHENNKLIVHAPSRNRDILALSENTNSTIKCFGCSPNYKRFIVLVDNPLKKNGEMWSVSFPAGIEGRRLIGGYDVSVPASAVKAVVVANQLRGALLTCATKEEKAKQYKVYGHDQSGTNKELFCLPIFDLVNGKVLAKLEFEESADNPIINISFNKQGTQVGVLYKDKTTQVSRVYLVEGHNQLIQWFGNNGICKAAQLKPRASLQQNTSQLVSSVPQDPNQNY